MTKGESKMKHMASIILICTIAFPISIFSKTADNLFKIDNLPENLKQPCAFLNSKFARINQTLNKIEKNKLNGVHSFKKLNSDETMVEIIIQHKEEQWIDDTRILVSANADYESVELFFYTLTGMGIDDADDNSLLEELQNQEFDFQFPVGFYMLNQERVNDTWENRLQVTTKANAHDMLSEMKYIYWEEGAVADSMIMIYSYNAQDRITEVLFRGDYDENGIIEDFLKLNYTLNSNGQITQTVISLFSENIWQEGFRTEFEFDAAGNPIKDISYIMVGDFGWQKCSTIERTFTVSNKLKTQTVKSGINELLWETEYYEYQYDALDNLVEQVQQIRANNALENYAKITYEYNALNYLVAETFADYDNGWQNFERYEYEYDDKGNMTHELMLLWQNDSWANDGQVDYTYDEENRASHILYQCWTEGGQWADSLQYLFNYDNTSDVPTKQDMEPEQFHLTNYPNPFNPVTTISFSLPRSENISISVYDLLGRRVRNLIQDKTYLAGVHQLAWDGKNDPGEKVASGVYFIRFIGRNHQFTRRCLLAK